MSPPNHPSQITPPSPSQSSLSITGIQPILNNSDDTDNKIEIDGALWSPLRLKRTIDESASNNLAMYNIIKVTFNCMAPLKLVDQKWDERTIDEMEKMVPKVEKAVTMLEVVRCKTSVPFNLVCQRIENSDLDCNVMLTGEECPFCLAMSHQKDLDGLCNKILKNPQRRNPIRDPRNNDDPEDVYKWVFDGQNHVNAILNFVCKDRRIMHHIDWMKFCYNVRICLYAALILELSNDIFKIISNQSPFSLLGVVFPMRMATVLRDITGFSKSVIGNNATELHDRAIQGNDQILPLLLSIYLF